MGRNYNEAYEQCASNLNTHRMFEDYGNNGFTQASCLEDGTQAIKRFTDSMDRATLEERNQPDGSQEFSLNRKEISFLFDKDRRLISYIDGTHIHIFEPEKQDALVKATRAQDGYWEQREGGAIFVNPNANQKPIARMDLGGGLVGSTDAARNTFFQLPDGGPLIKLKLGSTVSEITLKDGTKYNLSEGFTKHDPNLPKDDRLRDKEAIAQDATDAVIGTITYSDIERKRFSRHISEMPKDKQVEYVLKIKEAVDKMQEDSVIWNNPQIMSFEKADDGGVSQLR